MESPHPLASDITKGTMLPRVGDVQVDEEKLADLRLRFRVRELAHLRERIAAILAEEPEH
jgi:hypothetical protein